MRRLVILVEDCGDCPYYERLTGREHIYHHCNHNHKIIMDDYDKLMDYCELAEVKR